MIPVLILDNGGKTVDRYTLIFYNEDRGDYSFWGASENPMHPLGFGQYGGEMSREDVAELLEDGRAGTPISAFELPKRAFEYYTYLTKEEP